MKVANQALETQSQISQQSAYSIPIQEYENKDQYGSLQNGKATQFYFSKLMTVEYYLAFVVLTNLSLIIVAEQMTFPQLKQQNRVSISIMLSLNIFCLLIQVVLLYLRQETTLKLQKQQKIVYQKIGLLATNKIFYLIVEYAIVLVQPYLFFSQITFETEDSFNQIPFSYPLNDILAIFSLIRLYIVLRTFLYMSPYMSNRSNRICKMYSFRTDSFFSIKCLYKDSPLLLIGFFFIVITGFFGYALYIAERQLSIYSQPGTINICNNFSNSLWLIVLTITTVGYGDYFPHTPLGRFLILFVAVCGTFLIMIMVVVVANTLEMQKNEKRTVQIIQKLQLRAQVKQKALKFISSYILFKKYRRMGDQPRVKKYALQVRNCKKQFSQAKKKLRVISGAEDIYDQIATHFLNLNSDIQILNRNQENIINFIHDHLQFNNGKNTSKNLDGQSLSSD